ncbi:LysR substrate-binding domain-containing protein [Roseovarius arcticus]|uniref:LysR substrate-binding domain-containing protein n=1 Tax=Roseovarius arcticus TaxID=2547404 RepID=UPI001110D29A|nr:LysR substrate-binding domain-containing protein [Roseovarius arcticus]
MQKPLPNLNGLRVFEAAARHESFTKAADELNVTQSAVSKQVAGLEGHFGKLLFERRHKKITLTPFGREVFKAADISIATLRERLERIGTKRALQIRLVADADFVQLWLFPRLPDFERSFPDIRISVETRISMETPPTEGFDFAVIWGRGAWRNCRFQPLMTNAVFVVCAPGYFDDLGRAPNLQDVRDDILIHDRSTFWWSTLGSAAGARDFDPDAGRIYNQTALCLEAAARGDGLTVGDEVTTAGYLRDGRLICPFANRLPSPDSYFLVTPSGEQWSDETQAFVNWLSEQASQHNLWWRDFWSTLGSK